MHRQILKHTVPAFRLQIRFGTGEELSVPSVDFNTIGSYCPWESLTNMDVYLILHQDQIEEATVQDYRGGKVEVIRHLHKGQWKVFKYDIELI
jgi:hypothetical protein